MFLQVATTSVVTAHSSPKVDARVGRSLTILVVLVALLVTSIATSSAQAAQAPVNLRTANSFAVLAGSAITNTGPTTINGDLGISPGSAVSGFPPATLNGTAHVTDAVAGIAQNDLTTAYNDAAGRGPTISVPADLGGLLATPGVYSSSSSLGLTGDMTLDAQGDPNAVFIFKAGSTLTTASGSRVNLINGAQACNVFWQIGSSATLGSTSQFVGNLMALTSISLNDSATVSGRVLARNGAVTLINNTISAVPCAPGTVGGIGGPPIEDGPSVAAPGEGSAYIRTVPSWVGRRIQGGGPDDCIDRSFRVTVRGIRIDRVVFTVGGKVIARRNRAPFTASIPDFRGGTHLVRARVYFTDSTRPANLRIRFEACAEASASPPRRPIGFTG